MRLAAVNNLKSLIARSVHRDRAAASESPHWRVEFWLFAAAPPLLLYALEAVRTSLYHTARSPNMSLAAQLALTLAVYLAWALTPRLIFFVVSASRDAPARRRAAQLVLLGIGLAGAHIFLLTLLRLWTRASEAWLWRPIHVLHNYGEIWLSFGAVWLAAYAIVAAATTALMTADKHATPQRTRLEVRDRGETLLLPLEEIYWIKSAGNYAELHTGDGVKLIRRTLTQLESELAASGFIKAHRGALINSAHVVSLKSQDGGDIVILTGGTEAPISRRRIAAFKRILVGGDAPAR